jgi:transposase
MFGGITARSTKKVKSQTRALPSDQVDAEKLAGYARLDPEILRSIAHRTVEQQEALMLIRAPNLVVSLRTAMVNGVRGLTKSCGHRMPA